MNLAASILIGSKCMIKAHEYYHHDTIRAYMEFYEDKTRINERRV